MDKIVLTGSEVAKAIALVAELDPDIYLDSGIKAFIYKCKGIMEKHGDQQIVSIKVIQE